LHRQRDRTGAYRPSERLEVLDHRPALVLGQFVAEGVAAVAAARLRRVERCPGSATEGKFDGREVFLRLLPEMAEAAGERKGREVWKKP